MKQFFLSALAFAFAFATQAQSHDGMYFQGAARGANGNILANTAINLRYSIHDSVANGAVVYQETFSTTTTPQGMFSLIIGKGTPVNGTFNAINWGTNEKFVQVELSTNGGSSYTDMGTTQMMSVPYALYASHSNLINGTAAGNTPYWDGTKWVLNGSNFYNNGDNLGVGTIIPDPSAKMEIYSTTQGFLPPRMTTIQRNAIVSPASGLIIFNTTTGCPNYYNGISWYEWCGSLVASISTLNCGAASITGSLNSGIGANGVTILLPYTGGNGGNFAAQAIQSSGVTGLTAYLAPGAITTGTGTFLYTISGTPASSGIASFGVSIGGQSCTITVPVLLTGQYPTGTVFCTGTPTALVEITNPTTGKIWMDRNLGATQAATSTIDIASYGDLYQWGRRADGHQCRTSLTTGTLSSADQPANSNFIFGSNDWRSPQNNNLWQGVNGVNNPCPSGYRLPTDAELDAERVSWSSQNTAGAFASPLKLPAAGYRDFIIGTFYNVDTYGYYWTSTIDAIQSRYLYFFSSSSMGSTSRANGLTIRCIKD